MMGTQSISLLPKVEATEWRARFRGALQTKTDPVGLHRELAEGLRRRAWTLLKDAKGKKFTSFDSFCRAPEPYGLGADPDTVRDFLDDLVGKRRAKLLLVPPSTQGRRGQLPAPEGEKSRQDERLRAIAERTPEVVSELYVARLLTAKEAEKFGRLHQPPELRKAIRGFCRRHEESLTTLGKVAKRELRAKIREEVKEVFKDHGQPDLVLSAMVGTNADLFPGILSLYVPDGSTVADVTHGKGVFWRNIPRRTYKVLATDLMDGVDLRNLPYEADSVDAVVLDPPYMHASGGGSTTRGRDLEKYYRNVGRNSAGHQAVLDLYVDGAKEALRVLKKGGVLIVKTQDEYTNGRQRLTHVELIRDCEDLGYRTEDLFVLVQTGRPVVNSRFGTQRHARKNHSYFLVFRR